MSTRVRGGILLLVLVGFGASSTSTWVHYQMLADPEYTSFCDINESVSCTQVYRSRFGSFGGIPVALLGASWFALVGLLTLATGRSTELDENLGSYLLVLSTLGLAVALFLGYASFMVLRAVCILCVVVYVAVIGIFLLSGAVSSAPLWSMPGRTAADLARLVRSPMAVSATVAYLGLTLGAVVAMPGELEPALGRSVLSGPDEAAPASQESEFERFWDGQPRVDLDVPRDGAQVQVLKFNDYQCPSCAQTHSAYEPVFARFESSHPGAVRQVVLDYPLDPECNAQTPRGGHTGACEAAVAVRLARREGHETDMVRWLYENQVELSRESVRVALEEVTGMTDFDERYDETLEAVRADIALGEQVEIEATPTFVINGVVVKGGLQVRFFEAAIELELERSLVQAFQ